MAPLSDDDLLPCLLSASLPQQMRYLLRMLGEEGSPNPTHAYLCLLNTRQLAEAAMWSSGPRLAVYVRGRGPAQPLRYLPAHAHLRIWGSIAMGCML